MLPPTIIQSVSSFSSKISNPRGECFDASVALGILLASHGYVLKLVRGRRGDRKHWWLTYRGEVVDVTAHQFANTDDGYITEEMCSMNFDSIAGYLGI
jgi:hypothetical protein